MPRMPRHFRDFYLDPRHERVRRSGLPADLAGHVDRATDADKVLELGGVVAHFMAPRRFLAAAGDIGLSALPAALDAALGPRAGKATSYFLDMFSLWTVGIEERALVGVENALREILVAVLLDHFEEVNERFARRALDGLEREVRGLYDEARPELVASQLTLRFEPAPTARGARLMAFLFEQRPNALDPAPWPSLVTL
jgi:hypothetical protein